MQLGYNTNGLANHSLLDAIELVAEIGYSGISITLDHSALNPYDQKLGEHLEEIADALQKSRLTCVIETGARFLLDPLHKHEPTLVSPDPAARARRIDFLKRSIDIAAHLDADCVSLWSGVVHDGADEGEALSRLIESLAPILQQAERQQVSLAFEPEPGMLIETLDQFDALVARLAETGTDASRLGLTIDIGHLHCLGELPIAEKIRASKGRLSNVHIEDMRAGVHEHLMFGDGEIDFPPVIAALAEIGYDGLLSVELSRHSHEGPEAARRAYNYLRPLIQAAASA
jgi:L-ribulose-5-phosphate 3-epimerase